MSEVSDQAGTTSGVILSPGQARAWDAMQAWLRDGAGGPLFSLQGLAGTGKTVLLTRFAQEVPHTHLAALTGKAASVLSRRAGLQASTVHGLIYRLVGEDVDARGERELLFERKLGRHTLAGHIVLLDESSMVSDDIALDLLRTGCRVLAAGDPGQLPPVRGQPFFDHADVLLDEVHRQAWDSPIIRQAHGVRGDGRYQADGTDFRVESFIRGDDILAAGAILTWRRATRTRLNLLARQWRGLDGRPPCAGEPVVCLLNDYQHGLFNGAVYELAQDYVPGSGVIRVLNDSGQLVRVEDSCFVGVDGAEEDVGRRRGGPPFMFGYAMTVHKAQGSEWERIIIADEYVGDDYRRWMYTAITRARSQVLIQAG